MRFTESTDGKERANIHVTLRLTAEEIADIKKRAKTGGESWRGWLYNACADGLYGNLLDDDGSCEQRYGRGGD